MGSLVLTQNERMTLKALRLGYHMGEEWLGLTSIAKLIGTSLDEAADALAKPVRLGYVEQSGQRGAIYRLTDEGRRMSRKVPLYDGSRDHRYIERFGAGEIDACR